MSGHRFASTVASSRPLAAALLALGLAACSGARHRKVAGPPPEYEPPDDAAPEAGAPRALAAPMTGLDGGVTSVPSGPNTGSDAGLPEAAR